MSAAETAVRPAPRRVRPFEKTRTKTPLWQRLWLKRDISPTRPEYDAMVNELWNGDARMDELLEWMYSYGHRESRLLFNKAMESGIDAVPDAPEPLKAFFRHVEKRPAWVDQELLDEGVRFMHRTALAAPYVLRDLGLMGGYMLSGFNQTLVLTGALNRGASARIAETGKWWIDCTEINGMRRGGPGYKSTLHVRLVHALVRRNLQQRPDWDSTEWGIPVSQVDMIATYLAFCVVTLGGLRLLGIPVTPHESKAMMHFWSYTCWLMGVDEKWLCFTEGEGVVRLYHTLMTQSRTNDTSRELAAALAREPLDRHFDNLETLRRQLAYHQHLSVSRYFLGKDKMAMLGLPTNELPWFPLLTIMPRFAGYAGQRLLPVLRKGQEARGRKAQVDALASMFGEREQSIIKPGENHPAHT